MQRNSSVKAHQTTKGRNRLLRPIPIDPQLPLQLGGVKAFKLGYRLLRSMAEAKDLKEQAGSAKIKSAAGCTAGAMKASPSVRTALMLERRACTKGSCPGVAVLLSVAPFKAC